MTAFSSSDGFRPIGQIVATEVMPVLARLWGLPLLVSCLGVASHDGADTTDRFDCIVPLGECPSAEGAMRFASLRLSQGDICTTPDGFTRFRPRIMVIQDRDQRLILAGDIRAGIILWQQPVATNAEARRVVIEASWLRGRAFRASDATEARRLRYRATVLEARLVDPFWRETAAELLRLPQAA